MIEHTTNKAWFAREVALEAHGDQRYGDGPYSIHLDEVVAILKEFGINEDQTLATAYLHDVLEDTKLGAEAIELGFGEPIKDAVLFCTDEPGANRRERKRATYKRANRAVVAMELNPKPIILERAIRMGITVKLADRLANLRRSVGTDLMRMYVKERETFRLAYYTDRMSLLFPMWEEYERLMETRP